MANLLFRVGRASATRPFIAIIVWLLALTGAGGAYLALGGTLSDTFSIPGLETERVTDELTENIDGLDGGSGRVVFTTDDGTALSDYQRQQISETLADAAEADGVTGVVDPFAVEAQLEQQLAQIADGTAQLDQARSQVEAGQAELDAAEAGLDEGQLQAEAGQAELDGAQLQLDAAIAEAQEAGAYEAVAEQFAQQQAQIDAGQAELDGQLQQLEAARAELEGAAEQLVASSEEIEVQAQQLDAGAGLAANAEGVRTVSDDGSTALAMVQFSIPMNEVAPEQREAVIDTIDAADIDGVSVDYSSELSMSIAGVLGIGEVIGVIIAFLVLLIMMRALLPALQPIATSVIGVGVSIATAMTFSSVVDMQSVTPVLGVMLGLAVGIDYSLFIVNRHRHQRRRGMELRESIGLANGTSGNAVVFAGSTVLIALLALNVTGIPFLGIMGTVGAFSVAIAVLIAVTLTPALLGLIGDRALSRRARASIGAPEHAEQAVVPLRTPRALLALLGVIVLLLVAAIPSLSMRLGLPTGAQELPDSTQYRAYTIAADSFGEGINGTLLVTAALPESRGDADLVPAQYALSSTLMEHPDVAAVAPAGVSDAGEFLAFQVIPADGPASESTQDLVHDLRALSPLSSDDALIDEAVIGVAGEASGAIDVSERLDEVLPLYLAVVVGLSLIILIVVFRSLLVPLIASVGFVLTLFATFGLLTAVFQWGWLASLFGVHETGPILSFLPILLTGVLFGLAMDYQLFIATGMREAYVHGRSAREAVVAGMHNGRAVVTAAAIIMASVFGGFIFSHLTMVRPIGFGLAVGVLIDAFLVRMVIVPTAMHLIGDKAWWLPRWLDRLLPNVDVEGSALERSHPLPGQAGA